MSILWFTEKVKTLSLNELIKERMNCKYVLSRVTDSDMINYLNFKIGLIDNAIECIL